MLPDLGRRTLIMGVLNVTPDSFSDGGRFLAPDAAVEQARRMRDDGADIIDIGGESTRPGAAPVPADEELHRLLPVIEGITAAAGIDLPLSIDTTKARVARAAVTAAGTQPLLINDISAGTMDPEMLPTVAALGVPLCLMHLPVRPQEMGWSRAALPQPSASAPSEPQPDIITLVASFLRERIDAAIQAGISAGNILIDPGFGFGKSAEQNLMLIRRLPELRAALGGYPALLGVSRKSTIGRVLGPEVDAADPERLAGTAAAVALGAAFGVDIARVHDVAFMVRVARMADAIVRSSESEGKRC